MVTRRTSYKYIERVPGVCGGDPVIKGTRVPVWIIVTYWQMYGTLAGITEAYPRVSAEAADEALAYYQSHREEIDRTIEENDRLANSPYSDSD